jgi:formate dehydrogenase iron-sulfur subunit
MLAEAHRRQTEEPGRYLDHVFGEREAGGTSILYLSNIPLAFLAWNHQVGDQPLPELTWNSLKKVPPVIAIMGGLMSGAYWIIGRRMRLAEEAAQKDAAQSPSETETTQDEVTNE